MNLTQGAKQAYKLENKLGWNYREPLVNLQDFADDLASKYNTPPVTISSSPNIRRANCLGLFKSPNRVILDPAKGQNKATVLHEFVHYLDFRKRKNCPHDNKFRALHRKLLKEMTDYQTKRRPNLTKEEPKKRQTLFNKLFN